MITPTIGLNLRIELYKSGIQLQKTAEENVMGFLDEIKQQISTADMALPKAGQK